MANLRVRTPAEYLLMIWRRRYFVLVPTIIVASTLAYVISRLPDVYESSTLILVDQARINEKLVTTVNQVDISSRLGAIRNLVTSRTGLQDIIDKYDLYHDLKRINTPNELILERMRNNIDLNLKSTGSGTNAFSISFKGSNPETVRAVTADLGERFLNEIAKQELMKGRMTVDQLNNRLNDLKRQLEQIEKERLVGIQKNPNALPEQDKVLASQLNTLSNVMQAQRASIDSLQNQIITMEQVMATYQSEPAADNEAPSLGEGQTEAVLRAKRADLESKLKQLRIVYTDKHPEVKEVAAQIEAVSKELDNFKNEKAQEKQSRKESRKNNQNVTNLQISIAAHKRELEQKTSELNQTKAEFSAIQERLRQIPVAQNELAQIERNYQTLRKEYETVLSQKEGAEFGQKVASDLGGDSFRMQDPAYLPEAPIAPKRLLFYPLSLMLGLASGLVIALALESRSLFTIQDARDVAHYMRLPLLVTVPEIITDNEKRQRNMLRLVQAVGLVLLILVSVPVLITVLQRTHVMNVLTGTY